MSIRPNILSSKIAVGPNNNNEVIYANPTVLISSSGEIIESFTNINLEGVASEITLAAASTKLDGLAKETTLVSTSTKLDTLNTISTKLDGLATETTLVSTSTKLDTLNTISTKLDGLATQTTLTSASTKLDNINIAVNSLGGVIARETTLVSTSTKLDTLNTISTKLDGLATETTLVSTSTKLDTLNTISTKLDGLATETTLVSTSTKLEDIYNQFQSANFYIEYLLNISSVLNELNDTIDGLIVNGSLKTSGGITTRNYLDFPTTLFSNSGDNIVIPSPGVGFKLVISEYKIQNNSTTNSIVLIKKGATIIDRLRCPDEGDGVIQSFDYWKELELPANTAFIINLSNAVEFFISGRYRIEAV